MRRLFAWTAIAALALAATGCQALFTTSLASGLARTTITVPADISNEDAAALLASTDDPTILKSLLDVLNAQAAAGDTTAAGLAAEAAVTVSGVSDPIMAAATLAMTGGTPDVPTLVAALETGGTADVLTGLMGLDDPAVLAASGLGTTELAVAALILAASAMPTGVTDPALMDAGQLATFKADPAVILASSLIDAAAAAGGDTTMLDFFSSYLP